MFPREPLFAYSLLLPRVFQPHALGSGGSQHPGVGWGWDPSHVLFGKGRWLHFRNHGVSASAVLRKPLGCKSLIYSFFVVIIFLSCFFSFLPLFCRVFMAKPRHMVSQSKFIMYYLNKPTLWPLTVGMFFLITKQPYLLKLL